MFQEMEDIGMPAATTRAADAEVIGDPFEEGSPEAREECQNRGRGTKNMTKPVTITGAQRNGERWPGCRISKAKRICTSKLLIHSVRKHLVPLLQKIPAAIQKAFPLKISIPLVSQGC